MKGFFSNFKNRFANWLQGRYCRMDALNWTLLLVQLFSSILFPSNAYIRLIIPLVCIFLIYWRFFSKNYSLQYKLNRPFEVMFLFIKKHIITPTIRFFKRIFRNLKDIRKCRYRKCPHCDKTLRLPVSRGFKTVRCPNCQKEFRTIIL